MLGNVNKLLIVTFTLLAIYGCKSKRYVAISEVTVTQDTIVTADESLDTTIYYRSSVVQIPIDHVKNVYERTYTELENMLDGIEDLNFKKAVFLTENAYHQDHLSYEAYQNEIKRLVDLCNNWMIANSHANYKGRDSVDFLKNTAIYHVLKDTIFYINDPKNSVRLIAQYPYQYDFDDFFGKNDWTKMFVTKLMETGKGNCHSLPYLYKIIANELNANAYISIAPNHFYIKNRSRVYGWYNTELTSGDFPTDAWITASGYVSIDAIRSGIFMDTLSQKQSVALCVFDLAKGYERQKGISDDFIIRCCDLVLKYHPKNVNAMILKAETLKKQIEVEVRRRNLRIPSQLSADAYYGPKYEQMQDLYIKALELGYREMPERMYLEWLTSVEQVKSKYTNQKK